MEVILAVQEEVLKILLLEVLVVAVVVAANVVAFSSILK